MGHIRQYKRLWQLRVGDSIDVHDARGRRRTLHVRAVEQNHAIGEGARSTYVHDGAKLVWRREGKTMAKGMAGPVPSLASRVEVAGGDLMILRTDDAPGTPAEKGVDGTVLRPAAISCELPEALANVKPGHRVLIGFYAVRRTSTRISRRSRQHRDSLAWCSRLKRVKDSSRFRRLSSGRCGGIRWA